MMQHFTELLSRQNQPLAVLVYMIQGLHIAVVSDDHLFMVLSSTHSAQILPVHQYCTAVLDTYECAVSLALSSKS